ncbi:MAG: DUF3656 domain-containing U32 family peptidase [Acetivibrionales bacterium]|jgi:putative protease
MINNVELLAPAGDLNAFLAAVGNGADAVYLGGKLFNAREFAGNFDIQDLKGLLRYAHIRDVRVYLTMNTLISDSELPQAVDFAKQAYLAGIDGVIVQDIGFAGILKQMFPDLHLHGSTQMTIYDLKGVKALEKIGFKRVVLARELSLDEICFISKNTSLEIEVFIHGALCISYSGQCLMSSIIGARSGNRGKCAQPCRLPYELAADGVYGNSISRRAKDIGKYILSPKDLWAINLLDSIINSGVKSLKIEGRMKSAEYVATVVRIYRKYIDITAGKQKDCSEKTVIDKKDIIDLSQIFNRGGFTDAYLRGRKGNIVMCCEKPKNWGIYIGNVEYYNPKLKTIKMKLRESLSIGDGVEVWNGKNDSPGTLVSRIVADGKDARSAKSGDSVEVGYLKGKISKGDRVYKTSDKQLNLEAANSYKKSNKKVSLNCRITVKYNMPVVLKVWDSRGNSIEIVGDIPEKAVNIAITEAKIIEQLRKTGSTPFRFNNIGIELDEGLSLPVSKINLMRREALDAMEIKRANPYARKISGNAVEKKEHPLYFPGNSRKMQKLSAFFYKWDKKISLKELNVDRIYIPITSLLDNNKLEEICTYRSNGSEAFVWIPSITRGNYERVIENALDRLNPGMIDGISLGNIGSLAFVKDDHKLIISGDYSLNVFNSYAIREYFRLGFHEIVLSPEVNINQIKTLTPINGTVIELIVYGRIPLMTVENCIPGNVRACSASRLRDRDECRDAAFRLKDRKGMEFPVLSDSVDCRCRILNSNVMFIPDELEKLKNSYIDMFRLCFYDETNEEILSISHMHRDIIENGYAALEKYNNLIDLVKSRGYNKGHLFRGV